MQTLSFLQAFAGFTNRLTTVVFDNAFVVQGNRRVWCAIWHMWAAGQPSLNADKSLCIPCAATVSTAFHLQARGAARADLCSSTALLSRSAQGLPPCVDLSMVVQLQCSQSASRSTVRSMSHAQRGSRNCMCTPAAPPLVTGAALPRGPAGAPKGW